MLSHLKTYPFAS